MKQFYRFVLVLLISCQGRKVKIASVPSEKSWLPIADTAPRSSQNISRIDMPKLEEFFVDSLTIGKKLGNKIEISKYSTADSNYVTINFYSKQRGKWNLKNNFQFEKDGPISCDPKVTDFNNDGLNDITYISSVAARGANEIRRLFIYNKYKDELHYLKNSEKYPNMLYNKELNCIDAFLVYGGCSTVFLNITGDSLKEFASVKLFYGLTVSTYDKNGKEKIILQDTTNKAGYIRYKNYRPLREYGVY
jgi:hypothetical protein